MFRRLTRFQNSLPLLMSEPLTSQGAAEAGDREKRTKRNREKKVKRKMKEKAKKAEQSLGYGPREEQRQGVASDDEVGKRGTGRGETGS